MLSGFNTNVRHKGVVFHVQTEDSGRAHPHVITHLFHGGNILASEKQGYEHLLEEAGPDGEIESQVKRLMDEQHGAMLDQLRSGALDDMLRERLSRPPAAPDGDVTPLPDAPPPPAEAAPPTADASPPPTADAQRPLDEVVLEYLLESARQRSQR